MHHSGWFALFWLSVAAFAQVSEQDGNVPANPTMQTYQNLQAMQPDGGVIEANGHIIERHAHRLTFQSGQFHFMTAVNNRTVAILFQGKGRYRLSPDSEHERSQLNLSSQGRYDEVMQETFTSAYLLFTDQTAAELLQNATLTPKPAAKKATRLWKKYQKDFETQWRTNFNLRLLQSLLNGGRAEQPLFLAFLEGKKLGDTALITLDPLGVDRSFNSILRLGPETSSFSMVHTNNSGYWYMGAPNPNTSKGKRYFDYADALHYDIKTRISSSESISAQTEMRFRVTNPRLQALPIFLSKDYDIQSAVISREEGPSPDVEIILDLDAAALFSQPLIQDETYTLTITYKGSKMLRELGLGVFSVNARMTWFPNLGSFKDRATFHMTFETPKDREHHMIATGELVEKKEEKNRVITTWKADKPINVAGFNYGRFLTKSQKDPASGVTVDLYHGKETHPNLVKDLLKDATDSVGLFHDWFGPLPFNRLAVSRQAQGSFGQAWPSLVFLPYFSFVDMAGGARGFYEFFQGKVTPHEVAHQWFGHRITAYSYRDIWLEEGLAEFGAGLYREHEDGIEGANEFWKKSAEKVTKRSRYGPQKVFETGPISQGYRLNTHRSRRAYQTLVYSKGAYIMHMLRMMMRSTSGEDQDRHFKKMMQDFLDSYDETTASTEDFQKVVERHMRRDMNLSGDGKMTWFFNQWVHQTHTPTYESDLTYEDLGDGRFHIKGTITQSNVPNSFRMPVPIYAQFEKNEHQLLARIPMIGPTTQEASLIISLSKKPVEISVNAREDLLTR